MGTASAITTRAAIFRAVGAPQRVEQVELGPLGPTDVIVRMRAVGVCGSDLHVIRGDWVRARPMVLGHEGAGVVTAVGLDVDRVAVGDHVVLSLGGAVRRLRCLPAWRGPALPAHARGDRQGHPDRRHDAHQPARRDRLPDDHHGRVRARRPRRPALGDADPRGDPLRAGCPPRLRSPHRRRRSAERGCGRRELDRRRDRRRRRRPLRRAGRARARGTADHRRRSVAVEEGANDAARRDGGDRSGRPRRSRRCRRSSRRRRARRPRRPPRSPRSARAAAQSSSGSRLAARDSNSTRSISSRARRR